MAVCTSKQRKLSKETTPLPLYCQLKESLLKRIRSGEFSKDSPIPTEFDLVNNYGVSRITVVKSLTDLVNEGTLYRIQGKGTFVADPRERIQESHLAALVMPTDGHLFTEFARELIRVVQAHGFHALFDDNSSRKPDRVPERIERLITADTGTLIIDGRADFPFEKLRDDNSKTVIFIFQFETTRSFPDAFKVLSDFEEGGYLVIKHLLSLDHKKIIFYTYRPEPQPYFHIHSLLHGMRRAFREKGLDDKKSLVMTIRDDINNEKNLTKSLSAADRPTAAFALGDSTAGDIFTVAGKLGLSIPDDLAIVGYFNTPWCDKLPVPLTSVSIEERAMVSEVDRILTDVAGDIKTKTRCVLVKPKLVIRKSCGAAS